MVDAHGSTEQPDSRATRPEPGGHTGYGVTDDRSVHAGSVDHDEPQVFGATQADGSITRPRRFARLRRRRVLVVALVLLLVLFPVGDRILVAVAESQMKKQLVTAVEETIACGAVPPVVRDINIGGFPFITQILTGDLENLSLTVEGIPSPGPRISLVQISLQGIRVPFLKMITGGKGELSIDQVRATVRMGYDDLNVYLAKKPGHLHVTPRDGGRQVEISGSADLPVVGTQEVAGVTTFEVKDNKIDLVPSEVRLNQDVTFDIPFGLGKLLPSIPIPVDGLPLEVNLVRATTNASDVLLIATAENVVPPTEQVEPTCPPGSES